MAKTGKGNGNGNGKDETVGPKGGATSVVGGAKVKTPAVGSGSSRLFGTDGIRGTANRAPITPDIVLKVGQALGYVLSQQPTHRRVKHRTVMIGKDTRLSGYMVEQALSSGLNSMGVWTQLVGPLPTPGIGFLARNMRADAGVVISASHNAYFDNGIKIFGADGFKISSEMELEIERLVREVDLNNHLVEGNEIGRAKRIDDAAGRYIVYVKNTFPLDLNLDGVRIVLDCASGAGYKVAPAIFEELGAELIVLDDRPTGFNINEKTGALFPKKTCEAVVKYRADVGISLDGDGDRVILVDETGKIVNGDHILAICGIHLAKKKSLPSNTIVATHMSNVGLELALKEHGINLVRTDVGDKYVVEEMRNHGYILGGEQSGHIISLEHSTTGDGCVAALHVLAVMLQEKKKLSELTKLMKDVPQVLINTRVSSRRDLESIPGYRTMLDEINHKLEGNGRTFVRFSGTEPVVRVLVEGKDKKKIGLYAEQIAHFLQKELG
ncbi:MAG: phosphoglucosamine mutase [Bdellovibrionales bacterium]|nr:phosphoglucosamine mutase [Bdellovibrionales bacterium]